MIDKNLSAKVGMSYLKVVFKVTNGGFPYLKAFNQNNEPEIGVWVSPKVDLKKLFSGKAPNKAYSILGYYKVGNDKEDIRKDFIFINYISKVYEEKSQNNIPF